MDKQKTHLNAQEKLARLRDSLDNKPHDINGEFLKEKKPSPKKEISTLPQKSISFSDTIQTRKKEDEGKNIFQGLVQSVSVPLGAIRDGIFDAGKVLISPIRETQRTITYLKEESSAHII